LLGLAHAGAFHRRFREREQQAAHLEAHLHEARLRALQAQLQPHFLFNTLNGIATLLRRDPAAAEEMLTSLSDLLRIALSASSRQEIPLGEELGFLDRYLEIQRMRFGDRLRYERAVDPEALTCPVPALLLQPLVENAIRHGIEPSGNPGCVCITARLVGENLLIIVQDNGVGFQPARQDRPPGGVGLSNVRERLRALYGEAHDLRIEPPEGGGCAVTLTLPAAGSLHLARCPSPTV
jgi:sensor histidine kinase YesM